MLPTLRLVTAPRFKKPRTSAPRHPQLCPCCSSGIWASWATILSNDMLRDTSCTVTESNGAAMLGSRHKRVKSLQA